MSADSNPSVTSGAGLWWRRYRPLVVTFGLLTVLPAIERVFPADIRVAGLMSPILIFAILGLGLNVVTGYTGLLNLGVAGFMAVGAYTFGIATCPIYSFQLGYVGAVLCAILVGGVVGALLTLPMLRLRGDYLAIVTLAFGEIVVDTLKNLDTITKGTQGINPLSGPSIAGTVLTSAAPIGWYYFFLCVLLIVVVVNANLQYSRVGRGWMSLRDDELAARCMGIEPVRAKVMAFATGSALCSLAGALWASYLGSTGDPGNYDFQVSMIALCSVIVGGLGQINGVICGAAIMVGLNSIVLVRVSGLMMRRGWINNESVFLVPNNWKYMVFGLALILTMRYRPTGLFGAKEPERG